MSNYNEFDMDYYLNLCDELGDDLDDELEDEADDNDDHYRPMRSNSRKALLPLFVYEILKKEKRHHFSQQEILERLKHQPFEINVERKALSRTLHTLEDSGMGVCSAKRDGVWYDPDKAWGGYVA